MMFTIGIDAGGTKTTGMILDEQQQIMFETETGFGNPNVNFEEALTNVWEAVSLCLKSEYGSRCSQIVAGIAGIEAGNNRERFTDFLSEKMDLPVIIVNDAVLAYHALLGKDNGILTIAGTGSISFGRNGGKSCYGGGWGHLLGDNGSSYDIAIQACKRMINEYDQGLALSSLSHRMMEKLGIVEVEQLKTFVYSATKGEIAELSYLVFMEAEKGDEAAQTLFYKAGAELAEQTAFLFRKLQLSAPAKVACKGSLLEKNQYVQKTFLAGLSERIGEVECVLNEKSPATGAITVAKLYG